MQQMDWSGWHSAYDHPESRLAVRLRAVQRCIRSALDRCPAGEVRAISICAGQGRDLLGVLEHHPRKDDVLARLVELDEQNVAIARDLARAAALARVEIVAGDASLTDAYAGMVPANLALVCGLFGNISDADIRRTIQHLPSLCAPGAVVVWTRHVAPPDITPAIRQWFAEADFVEVGFDTSAGIFAVGACQFIGRPAEFQPSIRLFDFVGYDKLRRRP